MTTFIYCIIGYIVVVPIVAAFYEFILGPTRHDDGFFADTLSSHEKKWFASIFWIVTVLVYCIYKIVSNLFKIIIKIFTIVHNITLDTIVLISEFVCNKKYLEIETTRPKFLIRQIKLKKREDFI